MALIRAERVMENSTTTGTGSLTLSGPVAGFRSFASVMATSDTCYYAVQEVTDAGKPNGQWEVGIGTLTASTTLARTTVLSSSNSNNAVNFASGTKQVYIAFTAYELESINTSIAARAKPIQVDVYSANDTWNKPAGAVMHDIWCVGGGRGGASGGFAANATLGSVDATGGQGGGPGQLAVLYAVPSNSLTSTVTVTVGAGGAGGASRTTTNSGAGGSNGGNTSFGSYLTANGNNGGGTNGGGTGGSILDGALSTNATAGSAGLVVGISATINNNQVIAAGTTAINNAASVPAAGTSAIASNAAATGTAGDAGATLTGTAATQISSSGGGGGAAMVTSAGAATAAIGGDGGAGGFPGGGGGGGGGAGVQRSTVPTGSKSGKGGDGGSGAVIVITYF